MADSAGCHLNSLSEIERGKVLAKKTTLEQIAKALGRPLQEILGGQPTQSVVETAAVSAVEDFRARNPQLFSGFSDEMWQRFVSLCVRDQAVSDGPARMVAGRVRREFDYIAWLRDLMDSGAESRAAATLFSEHEKLQQGALSANEPHARVDAAHRLPLSRLSAEPAALQATG